jgi:hypothetical protein
MGNRTFSGAEIAVLLLLLALLLRVGRNVLFRIPRGWRLVLVPSS